MKPAGLIRINNTKGMIISMAAPAFDPKELTISEEIPGFFPSSPTVPKYSFPVPMKDAVVALYNREPIWQITGMEQKIFRPRVNPDNRLVPLPQKDAGSRNGIIAKDIFGVEWEFVEQVGASMVRPGNPMFTNANEWYDKLVWPDVDSWDWEEAAKAYEKDLSPDKFYVCYIRTGWFERLISLMDFESAIMALVDEDQTDAVKALFERLSELMIKIIGKYFEYFPQIGAFTINDDWGSQRETFFSPAMVAEMIVPYMRSVTDFIHSNNRFCDLHSCGLLYKQIPNMIDAGWDSWSPQLVINDSQQLHDAYGDKIIIGAIPAPFDPETTSEDEQRAIARDYADKFCDPKKPTMLNFYSGMRLPRAFREELYIRSRENYSK